jgi:F-type H+-transporting ATPase subunit epsilon
MRLQILANRPVLMDLKILLPSHVFAEKTGLSRIVFETGDGSYGVLPHRLDCVAVLCPGILVYENEIEGETYVAIDAGILVKTGAAVLVSVRNAIAGQDLAQLRDSVEREFLQLNQQEQSMRSALMKMESGLIRRMVAFHND